MGTVRIILALSVVFAHTTGFVFVGGKVAVQLFYVISGFLVSYILIENKRYDYFYKFYINRLLRLYPVYCLTALITLLMYFFIELSGDNVSFFDVYRKINSTGFLALAASNILLFGQDLIMFTGVRDGIFQFVGDFRQTEINVWHGLLVPQAWSLGVELSFYIVAPFVLKNIKITLLLTIISVLIRVYLISIGIGFSDPWSYRFFPAELALFLFGALSHQVLTPFYKKIFGYKIGFFSKFVSYFIFSYCILFFLLTNNLFNRFILFSVFIVSLPMLFVFQSENRWDKKIGDMSYPIYITHIMIINLISYIVNHNYSGPYLNKINIPAIFIATFFVSYLIERFVSKHIEMVRLRFKSNQP